jgi:hypothetical protein
LKENSIALIFAATLSQVVNRPRGISKRLFKPSSAQPIARTVHRTPYDG